MSAERFQPVYEPGTTRPIAAAAGRVRINADVSGGL
jgi:hypothetical protein